MKSIDELTDLFAMLPGIGKRQAKRFVYYLLRKSPGFRRNLAQAILSIDTNIKQCVESFQYFYTDDPTETRSPIARDPERDRSVLMVVEKDVDIESIEKSNAYHGTYFVLGGLAPVIAGKKSFIRDQELISHVEKRAEQDELQEIIFGLSMNPESEHTTSVLLQQLEPLLEQYNLKTSRLGRGLSTGTELEYSDSETLKSALQGRKSS